MIDIIWVIYFDQVELKLEELKNRIFEGDNFKLKTNQL